MRHSRETILHALEAADLLEKNPDLYTHGSGQRRKGYAHVAEMTGTTTKAVESVIQVRKRRPDLIPKILAGELTLNQALREAGYVRESHKHTVTPRRRFGYIHPSHDLWWEAVVPLERYLEACRERDFRLTHLNYKEAARRLKSIATLERDLGQLKEDLAQRALPGRLRSE